MSTSSSGLLFSTVPTLEAYTASPAEYWYGVTVVTNTPTSSGGPVASWEVSPELPAGLTLSSADGSVSGTPTAVVAAADYTVTATNAAGSSSLVLSIAVYGGE